MYDITKANLCINCENYMRINNREICGHWLDESAYSMVDGSITETRCVTCQQARTEPNKCGRHGSFFKQKVESGIPVANEKKEKKSKINISAESTIDIHDTVNEVN